MASDGIALVALLGTIGSSLVATRLVLGQGWKSIGIAAVLVLSYLMVVLGAVVIPPAPHVLKSPRVFGLGLSRTGTTSLTMALKEFGYHPYHCLFQLVSVEPAAIGNPGRKANYSLLTLDEKWANRFDALTDVQASVAYERLAEMFPGAQAKFILNDRDPEFWGKSMYKFVQGLRGQFALSQRLYDWNLYHVATNDFFYAVYGDWENHTPEVWTQIFIQHRDNVVAFFEEEAKRTNTENRLLLIDFTKSDQQGKAWSKLAKFLNVETTHGKSWGVFPRVDVFYLMFTHQTFWQLENLLTWIL